MFLLSFFVWCLMIFVWFSQDVFWSRDVLLGQICWRQNLYTSPFLEKSVKTTWGVFSIKTLNGTESQRTPFSKLRDRAIRYSGFFRGPWNMGPTVGDFLDIRDAVDSNPSLIHCLMMPSPPKVERRVHLKMMLSKHRLFISFSADFQGEIC